MCVCVCPQICMQEDYHWATPPTLELCKFSKVELIPLTVQVPVPSRPAKAGLWEWGWPRPPHSGVRQAVGFTWVPEARRPSRQLHSPPRGVHRCRPPPAEADPREGRTPGRSWGRRRASCRGRARPTAGNSSPAAACLDFYYRGFGEETTQALCSSRGLR